MNITEVSSEYAKGYYDCRDKLLDVLDKHLTKIDGDLLKILLIDTRLESPEKQE